MKRVSVVITALIFVLCISFLLAAGLGSIHISPANVLASLGHGPHGRGDDDQIVWLLRLPRICMAALVGASLAASGVAFQSLLRNDLADPYLIGVSAGASMGAESALLGGYDYKWSGFAVPIAAFASAMAVVSLVYTLAWRGGRVLVTSLLLGGVVISAFLGSVSVLLLTLAHPIDAQRIQYRLSGSLQDATFPQCAILFVVLIVGAILLLTQTRSMNLFALGEESAQQLGVNTERFKSTLVITGSLLTAATVAFAGIIGFVGLMVPHVARRLSKTPDHRRVLPLAVMIGAILMVWADTAARSAFPDGREIPVGIVTAFLGAPFFLVLLRRRVRQN